MKQIKKVNPESAQSVFSFYCPCSGWCGNYCICDGGESASRGNYTNEMKANNPHESTGV